MTTVFVTHDQEEAVLLLADQIALMFDGLLMQYASPAEFYQAANQRAGGAGFSAA